MAESIRAVWLCQHIWPREVGGVERRVEVISRFMAKSGWNVELWSTGLAPGVRTLDDGRTLVGLGRPRVPAPLWSLMHLWRVLHAALHMPVRGRVDVLYCADPLLVCAALLAGPRAPIVYCPGGTGLGSYKWLLADQGKPGLRRTLRALYGPGRQYLRAERIALSRAAGIVAESQRIKRQMTAAIPAVERRIRVIISGGDHNLTAPLKEEVPVKQPGEFTGLTVARLHRIKNIAHLVRAWAQVQFDNRKLWIAGNGPEMTELNQLAESLSILDKVIFLGNRLDVSRLLKAADVFILPSLYEACPLALLEAMTAGLPSITLANVEGVSDIAASGELNVDNQTGFIVDPLDPADMAARLDLLATDTDLRRRLADGARRRAAERFTWDIAAGAYMDLGRQVLARTVISPHALDLVEIAHA